MNVAENSTDPLTGRDKVGTTWEAFYLTPEFLLIPLGAKEYWPKWEHFKDLQSPQLMVAPSVELYLFLKMQRPATFPRYRPYSYDTICDVIRNYMVSRREKFIKGTDTETCHIGQDPLGSLLSREVIKRSQLTRVIRNHLLILGTSVDTSNWVLEPKLGHHGEEFGLNIAQHPFLRQPVKVRPLKRPYEDHHKIYSTPGHPGIKPGVMQGALSAVKPSLTSTTTKVSSSCPSYSGESNHDHEIILTTARLIDLIKKENNVRGANLVILLQKFLQEKKEKIKSVDKKSNGDKAKVARLDSRGVKTINVDDPDTHGKKPFKTLVPSTESDMTSYNQYNPMEPLNWSATNGELFEKYKNHNLL